MTSALVLVLASLVAVSGDFHTGLQELEKGNTDKAISSLSKVIKSKERLPEIKELAKLSRAQAYLKQKKKDLALADIKSVIQGTADRERRHSAIIAYQKAGGDPKNVLPKKSPMATLNMMAAALEKKDFKTVKKYIGGDIRALMETVDKVYMIDMGGSILQEMSSEVEDMSVVSADIDTNSATAVAVIDWDALLTVRMDMVNDEWQLVELLQFQEEGSPVNAGGLLALETKTLKQIGMALKMHAMDNDDKFPAKLAELDADHLPEELRKWRNPKTGKAQEWAYKTGLTEASLGSLMQVATPVPVDGKRAVLHVDGSVTIMAEKDFIAAATREKWDIPGVKKKEEVAKDTAKEVKALITKLGDRDSKVRADARKRLKAIGEDAYPFLKEELSNKDPEIRQTVKELLGR